MKSVLDCFLGDMKDLKDCRDIEKAHSEADELLTDLVYLLGKRHGYKQEVREIIKVYDNLDKWYA